jgi:origin recognition complex subunit 4
LDNIVNDEKLIGSFADNFEFLLNSFRSGDKSSKPLVFIMDEFDLFTKNKTQLLLYTLLNTIQSSVSPMFLIGVTCRVDVLDLLEKRIKSRFSHRQIYIFNDWNIEEYTEMCKTFIKDKYLVSNKVNGNKNSLNNYLETIFNDSEIKRLIERQFNYDKSISALKRLLFIPTLTMDQLKSNDISEFRKKFLYSFTILNMDTKSSLINGLSILELTLIVVMLQMSEVFVDEPFNFDLIHNAYLKFCFKSNMQRYEKQILLKVNKSCNLTRLFLIF